MSGPCQYLGKSRHIWGLGPRYDWFPQPRPQRVTVVACFCSNQFNQLISIFRQLNGQTVCPWLVGPETYLGVFCVVFFCRGWWCCCSIRVGQKSSLGWTVSVWLHISVSAVSSVRDFFARQLIFSGVSLQSRDEAQQQFWSRFQSTQNIPVVWF